METDKTTSNKLDRRFTSENELSQEQFLEGIQKAEAGAFITVQDSLKNMETWIKKREEK